eukprot:9181891-Pyramimonas_sp.AAC.1
MRDGGEEREGGRRSREGNACPRQWQDGGQMAYRLDAGCLGSNMGQICPLLDLPHTAARRSTH